MKAERTLAALAPPDSTPQATSKATTTTSTTTTTTTAVSAATMTRDDDILPMTDDGRLLVENFAIRELDSVSRQAKHANAALRRSTADTSQHTNMMSSQPQQQQQQQQQQRRRAAGRAASVTRREEPKAKRKRPGRPPKATRASNVSSSGGVTATLAPHQLHTCTLPGCARAFKQLARLRRHVLAQHAAQASSASSSSAARLDAHMPTTAELMTMSTSVRSLCS
jgi:hypothetical protein